MFTRIAQTANRLVRVATFRHTNDVVMDRSASGMRDRPPRPTTTHACRGTSVQLPRTPIADTSGPSEYQHATRSTLPQPFQTGLSSTGFTQPSFIGFNPSIAPVAAQFEDRHAGFGSSYLASEGFVGTPQEMDYNQYFSYPHSTQDTQEIVEEDVVPADLPQRREVRPTIRFSPADYDRPRAPSSARKPKRVERTVRAAVGVRDRRLVLYGLLQCFLMYYVRVL
ncbi:hypothetical protein PVAP13_6KG261300 [Panicum virgatum]|uniref:Uncharacterized protein n=1 Tax=Panicum virgatum TaxID=38727 RepID=A0A8T0REJ1_PANVG|nr:hypothetical protein PVAP13_6KG261300 [Panicum virgatum]